MTASSMRCCRRLSWIAALAAFWLAFAAPLAARADGIEVKKAAVSMAEDGYSLDAEFEITLTPAMEDVLNKGVPLYFTLEFELIRPRWYWFNQKITNTRQQYRLSYNALTRQYRVGVGKLYQNFASLPEGLAFMSRVRMRDLAEAGALGKGGSYTAALRMRLDISQLPRLFQVSVVGSRDWSTSSDWHRWTVSP
jgi:Domain of unknown function (DUF4390)